MLRKGEQQTSLLPGSEGPRQWVSRSRGRKEPVGGTWQQGWAENLHSASPQTQDALYTGAAPAPASHPGSCHASQEDLGTARPSQVVPESGYSHWGAGWALKGGWSRNRPAATFHCHKEAKWPAETADLLAATDLQLQPHLSRVLSTMGSAQRAPGAVILPARGAEQLFRPRQLLMSRPCPGHS